MMSLLTYFKAPARCRKCGHDGTAWIQSHLGSRGATYEVGDCPRDDIPIVDLEDTSFRVRPPSSEAIHVLTSWTCEKCGLEGLAEVSLLDGCIQAIDVVDLDPVTLERLHYIDESLEEVLEKIVGHRITDENGPMADWLTQVRLALEAGGRW